MIKKVFAFLFATVLVLTLVPTISFAAEAPKSFSDQLKQDIVDIVKNTDIKAAEEQFKTRLAEESDLLKRVKNNLSRSGNVAKHESTVKVDDNTSIDFYSSGVFLISTTGIVDPSATGATADLPVSNTALSPMATVYTLTYSTTYSAYNILGVRMWYAYVSGYFGYDNNHNATPTPYLDNAYYVRGPLTLWQVSNWRTGTTRSSNTMTAYCYARGNFHWGFVLWGNEVIIQDTALDLRLTCDKTGKVWGNGN